jgi:hypothetical protein
LLPENLFALDFCMRLTGISNIKSFWLDWCWSNIIVFLQ